MPDFECTLWPDTWFSISITDLCIKHDLGGTDLELAIDVMERSPLLIPVGIVMFLGLKTFGKVYKAIKKKQENWK